MIQKTIQTQNSLADFKKLDKSHLSIQLSLDGFAYCIFDKDLVDVVQLVEYEFESRAQTPEQLLEYIKEVFLAENLLSNSFESVNVTHKNNLSTIVPNALYDKGSHEEYLKYTIKVLESDKIAVDTLPGFDSKNIYVPFDKINSFILEKYPSFSFLHTSSVLVTNLLKYFKNDSRRMFFVNVAKNSFEIVYLTKNKLHFHNSFLYYSKEDFLYYILFAMEHLMLKPDEQELTFIGAIDKNSPMYDITYTYVRFIKFLNIENFSLSEDFYQVNPHVEKHNFFELLNQF